MISKIIGFAILIIFITVFFVLPSYFYIENKRLEHYEVTTMAQITDWRSEFTGNFPFAPRTNYFIYYKYKINGSEKIKYNWAEIPDQIAWEYSKKNATIEITCNPNKPVWDDSKTISTFELLITRVKFDGSYLKKYPPNKSFLFFWMSIGLISLLGRFFLIWHQKLIKAKDYRIKYTLIVSEYLDMLMLSLALCVYLFCEKNTAIYIIPIIIIIFIGIVIHKKYMFKKTI